ncbi:MAG: carbohydrate kinase [Ruminococcus sp.]|nr:carbohydrate kinase [Ruminococcus sp.]
MPDIVALGELLIDFTHTYISDLVPAPKKGAPKVPDEYEEDAAAFIRTAGGAPANVVCMAAKLGASTGFIGKIGRDMFGFYLKDVLRKMGVDSSGLIVDPNYMTPLAFVRTNEDGERDYVFYRSPQLSADLNLRYGEVNRKMIEECKIFHFSAMSLTAEPARTAASSGAEYAKALGKIVSYDPNWRPHLWESKDAALREMRSVVQYVDIIRVSENELQLITDCGTLVAAAAKLLNAGIKIVCVTQGAKGCIIATSKGVERYPSYKTPTVDTMGSGDCFMGAFLHKITQSGKELDELTSEDIGEFAMFANACGALSSSKKGAIPSIPSLEEVEKLMEEQGTEARG